MLACRLRSVHRQRDPQLPARPGVGAQEHLIGEVQGHAELIGRMLLELLLQTVSVLAHEGQPRLAQSGAWDPVLLFGVRYEFDHGQRFGLRDGEL